uniref:Uncharacterized protein n=1 Tax=Anguilla anguilla TaxID=7936 RepID=A0A0E9VCS7_ANGAN
MKTQRYTACAGFTGNGFNSCCVFAVFIARHGHRTNCNHLYRIRLTAGNGSAGNVHGFVRALVNQSEISKEPFCLRFL